MRRDLLREHTEPRPDEASNTVGMAARTSSFNQITGLQHLIGAWPPGTAVGQPFQGVGQGPEPVHARPTLVRSLPVHVAHHVRHLGQRAGVGGQWHHDTRAESRAEPTSRLLLHGKLGELRR